jgi:hypothetical protein
LLKNGWNEVIELKIAGERKGKKRGQQYIPAYEFGILMSNEIQSDLLKVKVKSGGGLLGRTSHSTFRNNYWLGCKGGADRELPLAD